MSESFAKGHDLHGQMGWQATHPLLEEWVLLRLLFFKLARRCQFLSFPSMLTEEHLALGRRYVLFVRVPPSSWQKPTVLELEVYAMSAMFGYYLRRVDQRCSPDVLNLHQKDFATVKMFARNIRHDSSP